MRVSCGRILSLPSLSFLNERRRLNTALSKGISLEGVLSRVANRVQGRISSNEPPMRGEVFSVEQLVRHAKTLAEGHSVLTRNGSNRLLSRLAENEQILRAYNHSTQAVDQTRRVTHAAEWLLDNFYLIEEQIQMARRHLPRGYSRELPRLVSGPSEGLPRVYDLVLELISHVDAQIDAEPLRAFIAAYQTASTLNLGELWAIPIMLRLALIENLGRVTSRLVVARRERDLADLWVNRLQSMAEKKPSHLVVIVAQMAQSNLPMSSAFVAEFTHRLARQSPAMHLARSWLEQSLADQGLLIDQMVHLESQNQAADQVTVSHTINSLRFLGALDWREFVETMSHVHQTLLLDPAGVYQKMDFPTRDSYRHSVEATSRHSRWSETEVARQAVELANIGAQAKGPLDRSAHVGFYLVDKGLPALEAIVETKQPLETAVERAILRFPLTFYLGGVSLLTLAATLVLVHQAVMLQVMGWKLATLAVLFLLCSSQLAVALINWLSAFLVRPRLLPRLDFSGGITPECRTMVVVPTMLTEASAIARLVETLEIHYLANRDSNLDFALLTDFEDAPTEFQPRDAALVQLAKSGIENLNAKYHANQRNSFFLFHRPRRRQSQDGPWMGYERKRGKLADFNALLRGGASGCFSEIVGDRSLLSSIQFVITLDTDTQLPRDSARQLAGTMAHPLNRPRFDPVKGVVTEGYSILQPRVGVSLPSAGRSWFVKLFAGDVGIDPYTRAVSDVYQDVFQEGSFIGKGIYDVDAFEQAVAGRFPKNTVLSHDLIEACHARSALVSDVELYEEYPSRYNTDVNRRHRWIRGDWQIALWLLPRVPGPDARRIANPLSGLSQWKIFDNLRRSLVPVALLLLLLGNWILLPQLGAIGILLVASILTLPTLLACGVDLFRKPPEVPVNLHMRGLFASCVRQLCQSLLTLVFLPYDAFICLDAIARTLFRLLITRKRLLEWQTSSEAERTARSGLGGFYTTMWIAPVVALACGGFLVWTRAGELPLIGAVLGLWLASPWIAWRISQPIRPSRIPELKPKQIAFLRATARRTWRFFETFVTARENWLPPDNFQEEPSPIVASRTSPTNMGLALLSNLAACDFGYLSVGQLLQRTSDALDVMQRMERHRGHFFNWYDTRTLKPLLPLYVSSVDSGNLAGHLLTLGPGLVELQGTSVLAPQVFAGLHDTLRIVLSLTKDDPDLAQLGLELARPPRQLSAGFDLLRRLEARATTFLAALPEHADAELQWWAQALARGCRDHLDDLAFLAPWLRATPGSMPPVLGKLDEVPTLRQLATYDQSLCPAIEAALDDVSDTAHPLQEAERSALAQWLRCLREGSKHATQRTLDLKHLARQSAELAEMDFGFLFDPARELFTIGYSVTDRRADASFYDLLASEARLCSFVVVAQGKVPQDHWFSLGRLLVSVGGDPVLASWSGSMFEYLMPLLVMPTYENTLLDQTCKGAVQQQIKYGQLRGVPWGVSESGYNRTDAQMNYQYRAFGVPGLGLKRGLAEDLVIAPYATAMALMVAPREACDNLERLAADRRQGAFGFYEAVDYTPSRLPPGQSSATIRSFMAHHQGMSLLSFAYCLLDCPMQRRFSAWPAFRAADLLLQERVPNTTAKVLSEDYELVKSREFVDSSEGLMRVSTNPSLAVPEVHLLSNGRYHVVVSNAGGGYSRWRDLAVTRWREDATRDCWGTFIYLRDMATGEFWSAAHQPCGLASKRYECIFTQARAEFRQQHAGLEIHTEISVSPEDDVELRRVTLTNHSSAERTLEITSYAEVVIASAASDASHPAFSNLFVQSEFLQPRPAVLCTRRPRSQEENPPWFLNLLAQQGGKQGEVTCETDRTRFIGRGKNLAAPAALEGAGPLSNTTGPVLDPVSALRCTVTLAPHESARIDLVMGMAENRDAAVSLVEKYLNPRMSDRALDLAWTHSQVTLRHLNASEADAQLYARLAGDLIYANPARRASSSVLLSNRRGQSGLWGYGISGDAPIILLRISDPGRIGIVQELLQAHAYWRMKGLPVDLVILNEDVSVYHQPLQDQIFSLITSGIEAQMIDKPGGVFVRRLDQLSSEDRVLLQSVARVVLSDENGTLREQLERPGVPEPVVPLLPPSRQAGPDSQQLLAERELLFNNGLGGFTRDGREYVIVLSHGEFTPAPWVNVLANPNFGTVVSESGSGYTWLENSHEFRLTPWSNDPVMDPPGEAYYIRDEQTGEFWSPTPQPAHGAEPYVVRHGFGYSVFEHTERGIASELTIYVAMDAPVKFAVLKLRNLSGRPRQLSITGYWEWVLGELRQKNLLHIQSEVDLKTGALLARNPFNTDFAERIAFVHTSDPARTITADRREFIGRNGSLSSPKALKQTRLSGRTGAGLDPCAALQVTVDLAAGQQRELSFRLGVGRNLGDVQTLVQRYKSGETTRGALEGVWEYWNRTLGAVQVETPDASVNVLANGWLLYQTLSSRLWARTGFYQSGGAFGFRDQLQDVMALVHSEPALTREHLLRAAGHQFREGDVQHWWHPPAGRGVRTHFSDDYLWLPYATCRYVACVADTGVLDEIIPFVEGRPLKPDEESYYDLPHRSETSGTLYQHCVNAIERGLKFGDHGLPLMGCGDWNDGMNLVGKEGRGESVWLGFFLYDVLIRFVEVARARTDVAFAERCVDQARQLKENLEKHAWDGQWYLRAFFDDGSPLGSRTNPECQIDSLPQSWSVLSGAGEPQRSRDALQAVERHLVRRKLGLIQLFHPPFDHSALNPGYIKGYIPGVRENGGQYTHGAIWTTMAFAALGETERAWDLFALLNPVNHSATAGQIAVYKVEPYVVAADVYAVAPHIGRGGWTWYTGSAGWMYRLVLESLLGVDLRGDHLLLNPRLPKKWNEFIIHYRYRQTHYRIRVRRLSPGEPGGKQLSVDGNALDSDKIPLVDDQREHAVELRVS
jgi:cyclic beta-1,2-glucan synthetase